MHAHVHTACLMLETYVKATGVGTTLDGGWLAAIPKAWPTCLQTYHVSWQLIAATVYSIKQRHVMAANISGSTCCTCFSQNDAFTLASHKGNRQQHMLSCASLHCDMMSKIGFLYHSRRTAGSTLCAATCLQSGCSSACSAV